MFASLGASAVAIAATSMAVAPGLPATSTQEQEVRGPDSARVAHFLDALDAADPVICELVSDQLGNFWMSDEELGIGRLSDARAPMRAAKDTISRRVHDAGAQRLLVARLESENPCLRLTAAKMLGNSTASDDVIARLLESPSARVREAALRSLGTRERPALRERIERMLTAREPAVAAMAAYALGQIEHRGSVGPLRRALAGETVTVRMSAAWALGEIEDPAAAGDLEELVVRDGDRRVRLTAIRALGEIEARRSLDVLVRVLDGRDPELSTAAVEAIGNLDALDQAPPALVRAAESTHVPLRTAAIHVLVQIDDPALAPALLTHITDADPDIRVHVIEALGELKAQGAVAAIRRALNDPVPEVRRAAIEALAEISER
jgi:HEAT repeat protein